MLEIEIKAPAPDLAEVRRRLEARRATFRKEVEQADSYFAHPCRDFGTTDEALRVRIEGGRSTLYYKGPKLDRETKTREEIAVPLPDPQAMRTVLQRLGFEEFAVVEKRRSVYDLGGVEVVLDRVAGLGDFVELEVQGDDIEEGKAQLHRAMAELGLEGSERRSYLELLLEKGLKASSGARR